MSRVAYGKAMDGWAEVLFERYLLGHFCHMLFNIIRHFNIL